MSMTLPTRTAPEPHRPAPAPDAVADAVTTEKLLRCWVRETGTPRPADGPLRIHLPASGTTLEAPVIHWSPTGHHRFGRARLRTGTRAPAPLVAALFGVEFAAGDPTAVTDLTSRVTDSAHRIEHFLRTRTGIPENPAGDTPFLAAEQALITGHPLHPTPKSREGLTDAESARYSPEVRGSFPLHWFAADLSLLRADSALSRPTGHLLADLAGGELAPPPGTALVPAHPWQAQDVVTRPAVRALLDAGLLHDLGPAGPAWSPTSSVRTLYRADAPVMLKLSLGLRITNSRRENTRTELRRGIAVHRLLEAGLGDALHAAHPHFSIVRDPAWLAVDTPGGTPTGLDAVIRDNPFRAAPGTAGTPGHTAPRTGCLAGLLAERPDLPDNRSRIGVVLHRLADRTGRPVARTARTWFSRYLDTVIDPVLRLYATYGLGLEAHQQNTLVTLDHDGWPTGGHYRDNQGYYFSPARSSALHRWIPRAGQDLGTYVEDTVIDERLGYYIGINNILGVIGALGSQGLADETDLLAEADRALAGLAREHGDRLRLAAILREEPTLRCKANLLTRIRGMDELTGPLEAQSVYVDIPNPIAEARG
ncbi:IucA/IucC family protein [Streptomyces lycii]|nr:IucA/IucC family protein [Streptomyces lycii]